MVAQAERSISPRKLSFSERARATSPINLRNKTYPHGTEWQRKVPARPILLLQAWLVSRQSFGHSKKLRAQIHWLVLSLDPTID